MVSKAFPLRIDDRSQPGNLRHYYNYDMTVRDSERTTAHARGCGYNFEMIAATYSVVEAVPPRSPVRHRPSSMTR